jgi:hypothetical protein
MSSPLKIRMRLICAGLAVIGLLSVAAVVYLNVAKPAPPDSTALIISPQRGSMGPQQLLTVVPQRLQLVKAELLPAAMTNDVAVYPAARATMTGVRTLEWDDLLPDAERNAPPVRRPPVSASILDDGADVGNFQYGSSSVNTTLNGLTVKLPGFVLPIEMDGPDKVLSFFLVPYYGACIHVPPPPPNQIVFVVLKKPIALAEVDDAQWVTGRLSAKIKSTRFGAAAYTLSATKVEPYKG